MELWQSRGSGDVSSNLVGGTFLHRQRNLGSTAVEVVSLV
jgi:hypothetical protein